MDFYTGEHAAEQVAEPQEPKKQNKESFKVSFFDWIDVVATSVIVVVLIFTFFFRVVTIDGDSMLDTLISGQKVVITNVAYTPKQGDIVVISRNTDNSLDPTEYSTPIIKRVIAVAGQTVDIDHEKGIVYVDGVALKEPYTKTPTTARIEDEIDFPVYIPDNCIFVMGDNRNWSLDSRSERIGKNGMIDTRHVLGKAVYRIFPLKEMGGLY